MAEHIDTISFAYHSPMTLPDRVEIWLILVNTSVPKFCTKVTPPPVDLSVGDIQWQIATKWLDIVQCSQWRVYRKPPSNDTVPRCRCLPNYLF